jgi:adenylate kinase family enzyme
MDEHTNWRRIHVIGGGGTGKTTLAQALGVRLGAPVYDLDDVAYNRPLNDRLVVLDRLVQEPRWVTEGVYLWWVDPLLQSADVILWLDVPFHIAAWRIVKRHIVSTLAGTNRYPGWILLLRFLHWTWQYHSRRAEPPPADLTHMSTVTRSATAKYLATYRGKVIRLSAPASRSFLHRVRARLTRQNEATLSS